MPLRFPHLDRPPIVEALLHFSVALDAGVRAETLQTDEEAFRSTMPVARPIRSVETEFFLNAEGLEAAADGLGLVGYRYESADGGRVAQFTTSGLTYSVVGAYTTWDDLETGALGAFGVFQQQIGRVVTVRLSTRFINRVCVPAGSAFRDYFRMELPIPAGVQAMLHDFQSDVSFTDTHSGLNAAVSVEQDEQAEDGSLAAIIDITAASPSDATWEHEGRVPDDVVDTLSRLREIKNRLFFDILTPSATMTYQDPT